MYLQNMTNMFTLFLFIGVLAAASAQQLRGMAPQGMQTSGLSSICQHISDKLHELGNKLGGMRTDTVMKAAGVPKQVRLSACVSALDYCSTQRTNSHSFVSSLSSAFSADAGRPAGHHPWRGVARGPRGGTCQRAAQCASLSPSLPLTASPSHLPTTGPRGVQGHLPGPVPAGAC
jgi:hypothetical protein